jgi:hypothetical protein
MLRSAALAGRTAIWRLARLVLFTTIVLAESSRAGAQQTDPPAPARPGLLKVYLDCENCFAAFLRTEVAFVDYVRDRAEADVHALITSAETGAGGREYTAHFTGLGRLANVVEELRTVTTTSDSEDIVRRQLATMLRAGLLRYVIGDGVPAELTLSVALDREERPSAGGRDAWNSWVFSLRGAAALQSEESSRETQVGVSASADRITPDWKITVGAELEHETEEFDLDEDEPVSVERRERDVDWLVVKSLGEHWSAGASGELESSTFNNIKLRTAAAPAVEYNLFPYSAYTRRQLRLLYAVGVESNQYYEPTLFGEIEETLPRHEFSVAYEQRERWGTIDTRTEWSQYLHDLDKTRLEVEGRVALRLVRGLSVGAEINASRIRDQLSLPARDATPEEILLRLRQLQSGYELQFGLSVTYSFGSIFSSIVNPRFGQ